MVYADCHAPQKLAQFGFGSRKKPGPILIVGHYFHQRSH